MSAFIATAVYAWCNSCAEGSEVGISRDEAQAWADQHDKDNHQESDS